MSVYTLKNTLSTSFNLLSISTGGSIKLFDPNDLANCKLIQFKIAFDNNTSNICQLIAENSLVIEEDEVALSDYDKYSWIANCRSLYDNYIISVNKTLFTVFDLVNKRQLVIDGNTGLIVPVYFDRIIQKTIVSIISSNPILVFDFESDKTIFNITDGTGDVTISMLSYPITNSEVILDINNKRGSDLNIIFPTSNIIFNGVTYCFYKNIDSLNVLSTFSAEVKIQAEIIDSTNISIRICAQSFNTKSV